MFVLADFAEAFLIIATVLVALISWIVRLVNESREQQQAKARGERVAAPARAARPGPRPQRPARPPANAQQEIDAFLRQRAARPPRRELRGEEEIEIEVLPDDEATERPSNPQQTRAQERIQAGGRSVSGEAAGQRTDWDHRFEQRRENLQSAIADRHLSTSALGSELRGHIERVMADAAFVQSQRDEAERELAQARRQIQAHREETAWASAPAPAGGTARGRDFAALLKNPDTLRDAIVINEILNRPRTLERRL